MVLFPDRFRCKCTALPEDMSGLDVLDIGGYDGALAVECIKRGAKSAVVVDNHQYELYQDYKVDKAPEGVHFIEMDVLDYAHPFDVVLAFDVIYHMKAPYLFAEKLAELTKQLLCISTRFVPGGDGTWQLFAPRERHFNDPTVAWKPTLNSLHKLLGIVGFKSGNITYREDPDLYELDGLTVERWVK